MSKKQCGFAMVLGLVAIVVIIVVLCTGLWLLHHRSSTNPSQPAVVHSKKHATITLIDKQTEKPLANKTVSLISTNGIICTVSLAKDDCPSNTMSWKGKTDAAGRFTITDDYLQPNTEIFLEDPSAPSSGPIVHYNVDTNTGVFEDPVAIQVSKD